MVELKSTELMRVTIFLQFIVCATVFLDIPVIRQVIGFVYFITIPGFIFINILKINERNISEIILLSVGFSIAFLMFSGLLINEIFRIFGITKPLTLFSLMTTINIFILLSALFVYLKKDNLNINGIKITDISFLILPFLSLPLISIIGSIWNITFKTNIINLIMITVMALLVIMAILLEKKISQFYAVCILIISISLLLSSSLISNYLTTFGSDIGKEYFIFKTTQNNAYWNSTPAYTDVVYGRYHSMLSITILPTIFSNLLNMNATRVLKILYPIIFAFVPLALYKLWQKKFGKKEAFAAAFLFMANTAFYDEMLGLARQMMAELFFVLLLLVIFDNELQYTNKILSFMIFSTALIMSHYALAIIFLFFLSATYILLTLIKQPRNKITPVMIIFFIVVMFSWDIFTSESTVFNSILSTGVRLLQQLNQFFSLESREEEVLRGLGLTKAPSIWHLVSRIFAYITEVFIFIGFIDMSRKRARTTYEREYFTFTIISMGLLFAIILVPGLSRTMNMTRLYHILLFLLSPLFILGIKSLVNFGKERNWYFDKSDLSVSIIILIVLVPYFLFQTEFIFEVYEADSYSLPLSMHRMDAHRLYVMRGYIDPQSAWGAQWMQKHVYYESSKLYSDQSSIQIMHTYGHLWRSFVNPLTNETEISSLGTVFLTRFNVIYKIIMLDYYQSVDIDQLTYLDTLNKIYTNGGSEIYKKALTELINKIE